MVEEPEHDDNRIGLFNDLRNYGDLGCPLLKGGLRHYDHGHIYVQVRELGDKVKRGVTYDENLHTLQFAQLVPGKRVYQTMMAEITFIAFLTHNLLQQAGILLRLREIPGTAHGLQRSYHLMVSTVN